MRRTVLTFVLFIGAAFAPDAGAGPLDPFVSVGCWSDQNQCGDGHNNAMLKSPLRLAVSPDGKTVYSSIGGGGIAWSTRDAATGAITPAGCIATSGCTVTSAVAGEATEIVVSPDGGNVYQATDGRLEVFDRDATSGALTYHECFNTSGDAQCTSVAGISTAYGVAISPDGANVYVASRDIAGGSGYLQAFTRGSGGHLSDAGCFKASGTCGANAAAPGIGTARRVAVTPDGTGVYVVGAPSLDGTIAWFNRSGSGLTYGGCMGPAPCATDVTSYSEPLGIAISPDGHSVYVATAATLEAQLHHFERASDNSLSGHECWTDPTRTSGCGDGRQVHEIGAAQSVAATNTQVFVAGHEQSAVTAFTRDAATGGLTPVGCVRSVNDFVHGCGQANEVVGLDDIRSVELSADNTTLYAGAVYGINAFQAPATQQQPPGGGAPGGGGPGGGGPGTTPQAPAIGAATLSTRTLRNGRTLRLTITLDRAATIRALVAKLVAGRKSKGRCVAPTKKLRHAKKCTRAVRKRTLTAQGKAGANTLTVKAKGLALGRYRIAVTATADGLTSPARTLTFTRKR